MSKPYKYNPVSIAFIKENINKMPLRKIAQSIGVKYGGLTSWIARMRKEDPSIPLQSKVRPLTDQEIAFGKLMERTGIEKPEETPKKLRGAKSDEHMRRKPPVEGAGLPAGERIFKTRKVVDGPIIIIFKRKNTKFTARDEAHLQKIIKTYEGSYGEYTIVNPLAAEDGSSDET